MVWQTAGKKQTGSFAIFPKQDHCGQPGSRRRQEIPAGVVGYYLVASALSACGALHWIQETAEGECVFTTRPLWFSLPRISASVRLPGLRRDSHLAKGESGNLPYRRGSYLYGIFFPRRDIPCCCPHHLFVGIVSC